MIALGSSRTLDVAELAELVVEELPTIQKLFRARGRQRGTGIAMGAVATPVNARVPGRSAADGFAPYGLDR